MDTDPPIFGMGVQLALKKIISRKTEGSDGIVVEMEEALSEIAMSKISDIAKKVFCIGTIPQKMKESEFIVIPKK